MKRAEITSGMITFSILWSYTTCRRSNSSPPCSTLLCYVWLKSTYLYTWKKSYVRWFIHYRAIHENQFIHLRRRQIDKCAVFWQASTNFKESRRTRRKILFHEWAICDCDSIHEFMILMNYLSLAQLCIYESQYISEKYFLPDIKQTRSRALLEQKGVNNTFCVSFLKCQNNKEGFQRN